MIRWFTLLHKVWFGGHVDELELRIANSRVMGAAAVNTTATCMLVAGMSQVLGIGGSKVLSVFGGAWLDYLWSWTLVLAWGMIVLSRWREKKDAVDGAWLEIGGILMIAAVFGIFTVIVYKYTEGNGSLFLMCAFVGAGLNLLARGFMLLRRIVWVRRAAR